MHNNVSIRSFNVKWMVSASASSYVEVPHALCPPLPVPFVFSLCNCQWCHQNGCCWSLSVPALTSTSQPQLDCHWPLQTVECGRKISPKDLGWDEHSRSSVSPLLPTALAPTQWKTILHVLGIIITMHLIYRQIWYTSHSNPTQCLLAKKHLVLFCFLEADSAHDWSFPPS